MLARSHTPSRQSRQNNLAIFLVLLTAVLALPIATPLSAEIKFLGPSFVVNTTTRGSQSFPAAGSNGVGTSVVAWHCDSNEPTSSFGICARRLSSTGVLVGPEILVNQVTDGVQQFADVAVDPEGNFFVVWESKQGGDWFVKGRMFQGNGDPLTAEFRLSANAAGRQRDPAIVGVGEAGWIVVWESTHAGSFERIYYRRFDRRGMPLGAEVLVSAGNAAINLNGLNLNAAIDADRDGNFVVAWQGPRQAGGSEVYARRFRVNGMPLSATFRVAVEPSSQKQFPDVAMSPDGAFAIVYSRTDATIIARLYRANGSPIGGDRRVNTRPSSHRAPGAVLSAADELFVTWTVHGEIVPGRFSVLARQLSATGVPLGPEVVLERLGSAPRVALDESGDVLTVVHGSGPEAVARLAQTQPCANSGSVVCVGNNRFKVEISGSTARNESGTASAQSLTNETGLFWFFDPGNIEMVIKVLDACSFARSFWVFGAGATDLQLDLAVTDTVAGVVRRYHNPLGRPFETIRDVLGFQTCPGAAPFAPQSTEIPESLIWPAPTAPDRNESAAVTTAHSTAGRGPLDDTSRFDDTDQLEDAGGALDKARNLFLSQNRFRVRVSYSSASASGNGEAVPLSSDSGYFWFFDAGNVEILVKVLDACSFSRRFWVFAAGLTDLGVTLEVTDTDNGRKRTYSSQLGQGFGPVLDTTAFDTCP